MEPEDMSMDTDDLSLDDLDALFGDDDTEMARMEQVMLTQNLDGFASCFPNWDLHPPRR